MTRETILRNRLDMALHNLQCYSANLLMTEPKEGCEAEYHEAVAEVEMLKAWLKEFHFTRTDGTREFVGHITGWSGARTYDGKPLAKDLGFEVDTGAGYLYGDGRIFNIGLEVQNWFVGEDGKCGSYDIEKDRRCSRLVKITVDWIEFVRSIEWVVNEDADNSLESS